MLQTAAFTDLRNYIKTRFGGAQYRVGQTWTNATIVDKAITADGIVRIKCQISPGAVCTIVEFRLLNTDNEVWLKKTVNVPIDSAAQNMLEWVDFDVKEKDVS